MKSNKMKSITIVIILLLIFVVVSLVLMSGVRYEHKSIECEIINKKEGKNNYEIIFIDEELNETLSATENKVLFDSVDIGDILIVDRVYVMSYFCNWHLSLLDSYEYNIVSYIKEE